MPLSKQQLGSLLWGIADTGLRGKVEDYKAYILSLLFFKRLSDNYEWETERRVGQFRDQYAKEPNQKQLARLQEEGHAFVVPPKCFWQDVRDAKLEDKNERLHEAVNAIAERNPALKGIINSVRWNEPAPDGSGKKKLDPEVVSGAINYLDPILLDNSNVSPDVLGDAYEYLIKKFADENKAGATAGQFYTPPEVRDIIIRFIQPQPDSTFYDPTCGSGGFDIDAAKFVKELCGDARRVRLFGQETIWNTWAIANINMLLHGLDAQIKQGNTIKDPQFKFDGDSRVRQFDRVAANFPFSEENWWLNGTPKKDAKGKPVLKKNGSPQLEYPDKDEFSDPFDRFIYGIPPFSNGSNGNRARIGNCVFIEHDTEYLFASFLAGFRPKPDSGIEPEYFYRWMSSHEVQARLSASAEGTTGLGNLSSRYFRNLCIDHPTDPREQQRVIELLRLVDSAIAAARESIAKAGRLQKGMMQQLLTGHLKPDGKPRRKSEFYEHHKLGLVPKGWNACRVRQIATQVTDGEHATPQRSTAGFYLLSARNIGMGCLLLQDVDFVDAEELARIRKRCAPEEDDLLISCSGTIGNVCLVPPRLVCGMVRSAALIKLEREKCVPKFIEWLFRAAPMQRQMQVSSSVSIQGNIFQGSIRRLWLMLPSDLHEQSEIADRFTAIEKLTLAKEQKIAALQRLKKSLMQNLLTGRIRLPVAREGKP